MRPLHRVLRKLTGLHYPQEYLCLSEPLPLSLNVYRIERDKIVRNLTNLHGFTGYHPLIFVIPFEGEDPPATIELGFTQQSQLPNETFVKKDALGTLLMKLIMVQSYGNCHIAYYEGLKGTHQFLSPFNRKMLGIYDRMYNRKPGNISLKGNLYDQVQLAYSVPRKISLVTVGENELFNLFPTDLHGPAGSGFYVDSLRLAGKAARQIEKSGKMLLSEMPASSFKTVYSLGKNHMQPLKKSDQFAFSSERSAVLDLPLPAGYLGYRELELLESFKKGIHQLFLFRVISEKPVAGGEMPLFHVHNSFATWLYNKGLAGNYLFR